MCGYTPYGLISFFDGPHIGRFNDLDAFRVSQIKQKYEETLRDFNMPLEEFQLIGDRIFHTRLPTMLALLQQPPQAVVELEKTEVKIRSSAEWMNGKVCENWKSLQFANHLRVEVAPVAIEIIVAAFLTNCLSLLQGGQTHSFFSDPSNCPFLLDLPSLESYCRL
jgi:hypothetical protein